MGTCSEFCRSWEIALLLAADGDVQASEAFEAISSTPHLGDAILSLRRHSHGDAVALALAFGELFPERGRCQMATPKTSSKSVAGTAKIANSEERVRFDDEFRRQKG
jgi:hypothetical protein